MKRLLVVLPMLLVTLLYAGCGSKPATAPASYAAASTAAVYDTMTKNDVMPEAAVQDAVLPDSGGASANAAGSVMSEPQMPQTGRKIIYDTTLQLETIDFAATQQALTEAVQAANGYSSHTSLENNSYEGAMRRATYVYRVPVEKYTAFLAAMNGAGNVISQEETTQDITAEYVDLEARLKSLTIQEERLMEMLGQAGDLETMLAIQNQLTEVQYRLESYTAQQRTFDDLVSYCTVTVHVREVKHATESKTTFGDRIGAAFRESWRDFGLACQGFVVVVVYLLPALLVLGGIAVIVIVIVRAAKRRTAARRAAMPQATQSAHYGQSGVAQPTGYGPQEKAEENKNQ